MKKVFIFAVFVSALTSFGAMAQVQVQAQCGSGINPKVDPADPCRALLCDMKLRPSVSKQCTDKYPLKYSAKYQSVTRNTLYVPMAPALPQVSQTVLAVDQASVDANNADNAVQLAAKAAQKAAQDLAAAQILAAEKDQAAVNARIAAKAQEAADAAKRAAQAAQDAAQAQAEADAAKRAADQAVLDAAPKPVPVAVTPEPAPASVSSSSQVPLPPATSVAVAPYCPPQVAKEKPANACGTYGKLAAFAPNYSACDNGKRDCVFYCQGVDGSTIGLVDPTNNMCKSATKAQDCSDTANVSVAANPKVYAITDCHALHLLPDTNVADRIKNCISDDELDGTWVDPTQVPAGALVFDHVPTPTQIENEKAAIAAQAAGSAQ